MSLATTVPGAGRLTWKNGDVDDEVEHHPFADRNRRSQQLVSFLIQIAFNAFKHLIVNSNVDANWDRIYGLTEDIKNRTAISYPPPLAPLDEVRIIIA